MKYNRSITLAIALSFCGQTMAQSPSFGERLDSSSTSAQEQREKKEASIPKCDRIMGTVAIAQPEKNWWQQYQLQSPDALIKTIVAKSGCFKVLDRGRGFEIAQQERALAAGGNLQQGSNIGGGQIKAADFVITPTIAMSNNDAGGAAAGAVIGGLMSFVFPQAAVLAGQVRLSDKSAEVTLDVTDVRTSEQWSTNGKAEKTDIGFGAGGGAFMGGGFGAAGVSGYANTAQGQVIALAYLDAYIKVVQEVKARQPAAPPPTGATDATSPASQENAAPAAPPQAVAAPVAAVQPQPTPARPKPVATAKKGTLYSGPSAKSEKVRDVPPGTILYPTANTSGPWWEVEDDSGKAGWVAKGILNLGQSQAQRPRSNAKLPEADSFYLKYTRFQL